VDSERDRATQEEEAEEEEGLLTSNEWVSVGTHNTLSRRRRRRRRRRRKVYSELTQ